MNERNNEKDGKIPKKQNIATERKEIENVVFYERRREKKSYEKGFRSKII